MAASTGVTSSTWASQTGGRLHGCYRGKVVLAVSSEQCNGHCYIGNTRRSLYGVWDIMGFMVLGV